MIDINKNYIEFIYNGTVKKGNIKDVSYHDKKVLIKSKKLTRWIKFDSVICLETALENYKEDYKQLKLF